jgi:hypothetical protein
VSSFELLPVGADWLGRDFADGDGLTLDPASRVSNAFSIWYLQGGHVSQPPCGDGGTERSGAIRGLAFDLTRSRKELLTENTFLAPHLGPAATSSVRCAAQYLTYNA